MDKTNRIFAERIRTEIKENDDETRKTDVFSAVPTQTRHFISRYARIRPRSWWANTRRAGRNEHHYRRTKAIQ